MRIATLNRWRLVYLAYAAILTSFDLWAFARRPESRTARPRLRLPRTLLVTGAVLWLLHDLAHGRWRVACGDAVALLAAARGKYLPVLAGIAWSAVSPEGEPSPFIWSAC